MKKLIIGLMFAVFSLLPLTAFAGQQKDSFYATFNNTINEFTSRGGFVQSIPVPYPGGRPNTETVRDLVVKDGKIFVFNGTFHPYLSIFDMKTKKWEHLTEMSWMTYNNVSYGGITIKGDYAFVTSSNQGIVRFNIVSKEVTIYGQNPYLVDLNLGLDGLIYALSSNHHVYAYDDSMTIVRDVDLSATIGWYDFRSVAVNKNGDMHIASWDNDIYHTDFNGKIIKAINFRDVTMCSSCGNIFDIDIATNGVIMFSDRWGNFLTTDVDFSKFTITTSGLSSGSFIALVPKPSISATVDGENFYVGQVVSIMISVYDANTPQIVEIKAWLESPSGYRSRIKNKVRFVGPGNDYLENIPDILISDEWERGVWTLKSRLMNSLTGEEYDTSSVDFVIE